MSQDSDGWFDKCLVLEVANRLRKPTYLIMSEEERTKSGLPGSYRERIRFVEQSLDNGGRDDSH